MAFGVALALIDLLGSSTGLGFAIAKAFAAEGSIVGVTSREMHRAEQAAEQIPSSMAFMCDLLQPGAGKQLVQTVSKPLALGGIDVLVTNAGGPPKGLFSELKGEDWDAGYHGLWRSAIDAFDTLSCKNALILLDFPHIIRRNFYG